MATTLHSIPETRLADIVINDPRTAAVFDRLGIDYCCQGRRTLKEATQQEHLILSEVIDALNALGPHSADPAAQSCWFDLSALIQHIVTTHHRFVREQLPILHGWLDKMVSRHGSRHQNLLEIRTVLGEMGDELLQHMAKEESILFPYIEQLWDARRGGRRPDPTPFGTIANPIRSMENEHMHAGGLLARLRSLTDDYQPPDDACTTYRVCFAELARFEADLHQHVHLENHILFPRAIALEADAG